MHIPRANFLFNLPLFKCFSPDCRPVFHGQTGFVLLGDLGNIVMRIEITTAILFLGCNFKLAWAKSRKSYCITLGIGVGVGVGGGVGISKMLKFLR